MAKHRIYIREDIEALLEKEARRRGMSPKDLLRIRVEAMSTESQISQLREEIEHCHRALMGAFQLLEALSGEVGFLAGTTRAGTKKHEDLTREGVLLETHFKRLAGGIRRGITEPKVKKDEAPDAL